ncbi:MAG: hypothetical protein GC204_04950 [Chloroflexi bacterium]|nr:hypothetical protein [Chloroflexota bacterium]
MPNWQFTPIHDERLAALPPASRQYLTEVGLPAGIQIWMAAIRRIHFTPEALQTLQVSGIDYLQIGGADYTPVFRHLPPNPLVIECASGQVYLLNGLELKAEREAKLPRWFFNSSVDKLIESLACYEENQPLLRAHKQFTAEHEQHLTGLHDAPLAEAIKELRQHGQRTYEEIRPQLEAIDPPAFASSERQPCIWPDTLLEIRWSSPTAATA